MSTEERKRAFVANLGRLMAAHGYAPREVAKRAGIADVKRFYRWAAKGVARPHHEHDDDLERLRAFFQLGTVSELWRPAPLPTLADRLREAGEVGWEYAAVFKLLVVLRAGGREDARRLVAGIEELFAEATQGRDQNDILRPRTGEQVAADFAADHPLAYRTALRSGGWDHEELVRQLRPLLRSWPDGRALIDHLVRSVSQVLGG